LERLSSNILLLGPVNLVEARIRYFRRKMVGAVRFELTTF
jgi:hypothetical protein